MMTPVSKDENQRTGLRRGRSFKPFKWLGANKMTIAFSILGLIILLFIAVPLGKMIFGSDPKILLDVIRDPEVIHSIWLTLYAALIAAVAGFIFGVPLAYILSRYNFRGKRLLEGLIDVPIVVPHTAAGIALLFVFGRSFLAGRFFGSLGISFIDSIAGIVIAMLFVSVPFLIDTSKEGFNKVDVRLEKVARSLGASPWQTFTRVTLPLAWRSIVAGNIMMCARGISEFGAVIILAYYPMTASTLIYQRFETQGLAYSQPIAALLIFICVIAFIILRWLAYRGMRHD